MRKLHPHQQISGLRGLTVEDFWIWGYSDMLTNVVRNTFAEFIVGFALGRLNTPKIGQDNTVFHYRDKEVVVRAAAFVQSGPQQKTSKVNFDVRIRKGQGIPDKSGNPDMLRASDCHVFCLFTFKDVEDKDAARNALIDIEHWRFYIMPTKVLNEKVPKKKTVGIRWMEINCLNGPVAFADLKNRIDQALGFSP